MKKWFSMDNPVIRALDTMADLIILNILVVICCFPILTAGPAMAAMHYVLMKIVRGEDGYIFRDYFKAFKQNFKQGFAVGFVMLLIVIFLGCDYVIFSQYQEGYSSWLEIIVIGVTILASLGGIYIFPVMARYEDRLGVIVRNSYIMALCNLPKTVLMLAATLLPVVMSVYIPQMGLFMLVLGFSAPGLLCAYFYQRIFYKAEGKDADGEPLEPVEDSGDKQQEL